MLYYLAKYIFLIYFLIFNRVKVDGLENIPERGGIIICPNHIHWLDPILVGVYTKRKIHYMAKAEAFKNKLFAFVLRNIYAFPVKRGTPDISAIKTSLKIVKNGKCLGIFPEGHRSENGKLQKAEPGVALISLKSKTPVIPVKITGSYKPFSKLKITIGKPISFLKYSGKKLSMDEINKLSQLIMKEISELA
ncbi:MAG: lysophospholipid acyltransferase family protein [Clostridiales bacterium]|nr:lysophospholipid acyltransferase family protein [Clostridiales bacterium]